MRFAMTRPRVRLKPDTTYCVFMIAFCLGAALLAAQESKPWFGTPVPPAANDPRKPVMKYDDGYAPVPAHFTHRAGRFDELFDGAALKRDHKTIVGFSLESLAAGDAVWGRRAATPSFMRTIAWTVNELKAAGLKDARAETFAVTGTMWVPQSWQVQVAGESAFGAGTESFFFSSRRRHTRSLCDWSSDVCSSD